MKKNITLSMDVEVWAKARSRFKNISHAIEELLIAFFEQTADEQDETSMRNQIKTLNDTITALKAELNIREEQSRKQLKKHNFEYYPE